MLASPGEGALSAIGADHRVAGVAGASPAAFESDESNDRVKRDRHDERRRSRSMRKSSLRRDIPVPAAKQDLPDAAAQSRDSPVRVRLPMVSLDDEAGDLRSVPSRFVIGSGTPLPPA
jgi:hypothetical protein